MQTLILYKSRNGATKQYAQWLHQELPDSDLANMDEFNISDLAKYQVVVVGSCTYEGQILAQDFLEQNWDILKEKKVYLMVVGAIPQDAPASQKSFAQIPTHIRGSLAGYAKLPGKLQRNIGPLGKLLMKLFGQPDFSGAKVDRSKLQPVVEFLQQFSS